MKFVHNYFLIRRVRLPRHSTRNCIFAGRRTGISGLRT